MRNSGFFCRVAEKIEENGGDLFIYFLIASK